MLSRSSALLAKAKTQLRIPRLPDFPPLPERPRSWPEEPPLDAGLAELSGWWLHVFCGCKAGSYLPLRLMAAQHGWTMRLGTLAARLRCESCGEKPRALELVDNPAASFGAYGGQGQQRLRLSSPILGTENQ